MNIIPVSIDGIARAVETLRSGGVLAHATETCYGLACDLRNPKALERLFAIKKRPTSQPVSALFFSLDEAKTFVHFSEKALEIAKRHLPGPLTLVLPVRSDAPFTIHVCPPTLTPVPSPDGRGVRAAASGERVTIGIRLSSFPFAQQLSAAFGSPIATTSANVHGQKNAYSAEDIVKQYGSEGLQPDLILDSGPIPVLPASTVVEVIGDVVKVLRQGDIALA